MTTVTQDRPLSQEEGHDLLTVREVAQALRVDETTVRRWIKFGALDAIALPHRGKRQAYRVLRTTLNTVKSAPAAVTAV